MDENESHLSSIISLNTLTNVITKPNRITRNSASLIDPVLVTDSINVKYADILDVESNISDHKATSILINFNYKPKLCSKRKVWYYDRADFIQLNNRIFIEEWSFINVMDVNDACERFTYKLLEMMTQFIPSKEVTIRPNDKPWYDSEIRRLSRHRDRHKAIVIVRGRDSDWEKI